MVIKSRQGVVQERRMKRVEGFLWEKELCRVEYLSCCVIGKLVMCCWEKMVVKGLGNVCDEEKW